MNASNLMSFFELFFLAPGLPHLYLFISYCTSCSLKSWKIFQFHSDSNSLPQEVSPLQDVLQLDCWSTTQQTQWESFYQISVDFFSGSCVGNVWLTSSSFILIIFKSSVPFKIAYTLKYLMNHRPYVSRFLYQCYIYNDSYIFFHWTCLILQLFQLFDIKVKNMPSVKLGFFYIIYMYTL